MGDPKLFLLVLLCTIVLADANDDSELCLLAKRYKSLHKYEYLYEAESLNSLNGAINGPKFSCQVEIEVPGTCQYIVHTKECTVSEVMDVDADGNPVFGPAAGADTFKAEMEKNPLKVLVEPDNDIKLFPEDGELINILNIKRGIVSALAVPGGQEDTMTPTIYGPCKTDYIVNSEEEITINRHLSKCDHYTAIKGHTSPLAILSDTDFSADLLFNSKQTCNYKFDSQMNHVTSVVCTENHLVKFYSYKDKYGATSVGKQMLSFLGVNKYNERVFDYNEANMKTLYMDESVDMSAAQDENAILAVLKELVLLSQTTDGHKRPHLAYKLVSMMRQANADTLSALLEEGMKISPSLMYQALFQCGSQECSGALMQIIRTRESAETDAVLYAMGMVPSPTPVLINDMLEMAKLKPSKLVYYALSNAIRRRYQKIQIVTPEIKAVADFALEQIGDCTGDQEHTYLTLRVLGNMATAAYAASPALKSAVIQCINQPATSPEVQQAAIQVFRMAEVSEENRSVLMKVLLDADATVQKRLAAYLILMKDPQANELQQLATALPSFENVQVKSFVISHLTNILSSTAPETRGLREKILDAFQGNEVGNVMDPTRFSRNYKFSNLEGHMIFEKEDKLPKEMILEMTLNAFGFYEEMVELGMESKGLEPTVEALFGSDGFFPDTVLKTIFFATDKMPSTVNEVLNNMIPGLENERKKRQVPKGIIKEISKNVDKLIKSLNAQDTPEAMLYLRILGAELGYLKTKDIEDMAYGVAKMAESLVKMFPTDHIMRLFLHADNGIFLHYIYLDYQYFLPTCTGVPMRIGLHSTMTPGVTGGLRMSPYTTEVAFLPSYADELVAEVGTHLPDYVDSGLELHINVYHESGIRVKFTMAENEITLTFPSANPMELLSVRTYLMSEGGGKTKRLPSTKDQIDYNQCQSFSGVKLCFIYQIPDARSDEESPYLPLTGDSKFAIELHPSYEVSAYTATIKYDFVENTDKVTLVVKPEGLPTEAKVNLMFNRNEYTASADLQIPGDDVDAGIRIGAAESKYKGEATHSIQMDLINKNIHQASLVGLAKIETMNDAQLQVQMHVPALDAVAKATASMKRDGDLTVELESDLKFHRASSVQKIILKYDDEKIAAEIKSDSNVKIREILHQLNRMKDQSLLILDSEMMLTSSVKDIVNYLEAAHVPSIAIEVPENLFLNMETDVKYFYKDYYTITLPMPLAGKSAKDLNIPPELATPRLSVPQFGLDVASIRIPLPDVYVPETLIISMPIPWRTEVAGKIGSNYYDLDATASAGRESDEHQSYSARFKVTGASPVDLLSIKVEGATIVTGILTDAMTLEMNTVVSHKVIEARINLNEELTVKENINLKSSTKLDAKSPLGLKLSLEHTGQIGLWVEEITGENYLHGSLVTAPIKGDVTLTQSFAVSPFIPKAKCDSLIKVDSTPFQGQNKMEATFSDGELSVLSKTAAFNDRLTHSAGITLMKSKLAMQSDTKASVLGMKIQNSAEASVAVGDMKIKIETTSSRSEDHINSLVTARVNANGLVVDSDSSVKLAKHTATQKASLTVDKNGMATSGTTSVNSFVTLNNTFNGIVHSSKASLSVGTVGNFGGVTIDNSNSLSASMSAVALSSTSKASFAKDVSYVYDISVQAEPYSATADINNNLKLGPDTELKHTCQMKIADLTAMAKCNSNGKLRGAQVTHETEMEIVGLNIRFKNDARINSQPVRLSNNLQATASPFNFNLHALTNGDGEVFLLGKHSGQVFTKLLIKAEPLALAHSHEGRLSVTHEFTNGVTFETNFDNRVNTLLTPSEQSGSVEMRTKINNYLIDQKFNTYNKRDKIGAEFLGNLTNTAFTNDQDVSLSASVIYDKTTESNVINLQSLEVLPALLENIKMASVNLAEELRDYMKREQFAAKIQSLLQRLSDFINKLNIEEQAVHLKKYFLTLAKNCPVTTKDLDAAAKKLQTVVENIIHELKKGSRGLQNTILTGDVMKIILEKVAEVNKEYDIQGRLVALIRAIEDVINQIDINELKNAEFFQGFDRLDQIKSNLEEIVSTIRRRVERFEAATFVADMRQLMNMFEKLIFEILRNNIRLITDTMKPLVNDLNLVGKCEALYRNVRAFAEKYQLDKTFADLLDKIVDLIKQLKINKTAQALVNHLKSVEVPFKHLMDDFLNYLKDTEIKTIIEDVNKCIEDLIRSLKSFEYNTFVDKANKKIRECTTKLDKLVTSLELTQKAKATREFLNHAFSEISSFLQKLKATKVSEIIESMNDLIDGVVLNDIKTFARKLKMELEKLNIKEEIQQVVKHVNEFCTEVFAFVTKVINDFVDLSRPIDQLVSAMQTAELEFPSFTVPLTDLVLPSVKFSLQQLKTGEIPTELHLPEFTILGSYQMPEITISCDSIKELLMDLIDIIVTFEMKMLNYPYVEDLTLDFLPDLYAITLPQFTIPQISLPALPELNDNFMLDIPLQIPEIKLPKIPSEIAVPTFGRLHGQIVFNSPIYTLRTTAEIQNSTDSYQRNHLIAFISSDGTSPTFDVLNYHLDATTRIGIPRMSRVVIAETVKFTHSVLNVEHQASVTLYGLSAQAIAQTTVKAMSTPYNAEAFNKAFFAVGSGMTISSEASYKHQVNVQLIPMTSDVTLSQKTFIRQKDTSFSLKTANEYNEKYSIYDFVDKITHNSELNCTMDPVTVKLAFKGDTNSDTLFNVKKTLNADASVFNHIDINARVETKSPFIKNSVIAANAEANLRKMLLRVSGTHDTELLGAVSGKLSNALNFRARPLEIFVDFQNKANTKVHVQKSFSAKIDLQNDYTAVLNTRKQHLNTAALVRFNQNKYRYNFTLDNNNADAGVYASVNGEADLEFLNVPISIPEMVIPSLGVDIQAINDVNLLEYSGLKNLITTKPTLDVNAKTVYQKSKLPPVVTFGPIRVYAPGILVSEMSFKSTPFNLNANAEMNGDIRNSAELLSASVNTPLSGHLGFELHGKKPSQLTSRLYRRHASEPANEIDMLTVSVKAKEESLLFHADYNLEEHRKIVKNAEQTLGFALLAISISAHEYGVSDAANEVMITAHDAYTEAYTATVRYASELPDLRELIAPHEQAIQNVLTAIVRFLRETQIQLPGMEKATLPEICQQIRNNAAMMFEQITHGLIEHLKACSLFQSIKVHLPRGKVLTADKIINFLKHTFAEIAAMIKQHEGLDVILENLSHDVLLPVERARDLIQETFFIVRGIVKKNSKWLVDGGFERFIERFVELIVNSVNEFAETVSNEIPTGYTSKLRMENGSLEIELPLIFPY